MQTSWFKRFWNRHGERLVFAGLAMGIALFFYFTGDEKLIGSSYTIMIGVAMLMFHKARGNEKDEN